MGKIQAVVVVVVALALDACSKETSRPAEGSSGAAPSPATTVTATPDPPAPPAPPTEAEILTKTDTLAGALDLLRAKMSDTDDEPSPGAVILALWSAEHLHWTDVAVAKNETSFALVHKDSDAARGKRMCFYATIIQIAKEKAGATTLFDGLMMTNGSQLTKFLAVGSTGELVGESDAHFCGVVTGLYDYSNSAGGKGHAVSVVGMFDLPENRSAKAK